MEGASFVSIRGCGFSAENRDKKWQGGHFYRAFRGLPSRPVLRTRYAPPPIPARLYLQNIENSVRKLAVEVYIFQFISY